MSRPSTCHPERLAHTKDGRCEACYRREKRRVKRIVPTALDKIEETKVQLLTLQEAVAKAEQELIQAVPEAAQALRRAASIAAEKGISGPAETILREFPVPTSDGKSRRLLSPQKNDVAQAPSGPQILIGFIQPPATSGQPVVSAELPPAAAEGVVTEEEAVPEAARKDPGSE